MPAKQSRYVKEKHQLNRWEGQRPSPALQPYSGPPAAQVGDPIQIREPRPRLQSLESSRDPAVFQDQPQLRIK